MNTPTFSIGDAFSRAWQLYKSRPGLLIGLFLILLLIGVVPGLISRAMGVEESHWIVTVILWVVQTFIQLGIIRVSLKLVDNKETSIGDIFSFASYEADNLNVVNLVLRTLGANILMMIMVGIIPALIVMGAFFVYLQNPELMIVLLVLAVIVALIMSIPFQFFTYALIDKKVGVVDSLKESWYVTKGNRTRLFGMMIVVGLFSILAIIPVGLGLLLVVPLSWLAYAYVYRTLASHQMPAVPSDVIPNTEKNVPEDI